MVQRKKPTSDAWWLAKPGDEHKLAVGWVNACRKNLASYRDNVLYYMSLFNGSTDLTGTGLNVWSGDKLRYNLVSSICETAQSIVGAARTLPQHQPRNGDWSIQRKAKRRTACLQAQFQDLGIFSLGSQAITDGMVTGLGVTYVYIDPDTDLPAAERVLPLELVWDPTEATAGEVRTIGRSKPVAREVLKALYPEHADEIICARGPSVTDLKDFALQRDGKADQVVVHEVWHLPSKKGAKDGRHVIFVDGATLFSEKWTRPRFPFAIYRWAPRQVGFVGKSLVAEVEPAQKRVEKLLAYIETCQDLGSKPQVWVEKGAQVEPEQIDNLPMTVNRFTGQLPTFFTFDATPHDLESTVDMIRERAMSQLGLSTQQISGEKPAGVSSAVGMRTLEDISSKRHVINIRQVEQYYLQVAQCLSDVNDEVSENTADFAIDRRVRARFLDSTKWSECKLEEGEMRMVVYPISALPPSPTGQLETIEQWIQGQYIDRDAGMTLLGMPDVEAYSALETADRNYIEWQVEAILDGKKVIPDKYCNLEMAMTLVREHYLNARTDGAPPEVLDAFRRYLEDCRKKVEAAAPPPAPAPLPGPAPTGPDMALAAPSAPMGGPPPGMPMQ